MSKGTGVSWYTEGQLHLPVYFPEGEVFCRWCPYIRYDESLRRHRCLFTDEYILYPMDSRGTQCPITFKEDNDNEFDR